MVFTRNINKIAPDLQGNLERDLNILVRAIITDLSTEQNSPVDTGFFASSWTASTQRPRPNESRKDHAPWKGIKPSRDGTKASGAVVEPRFLNTLSFNFKPFSKVFIGNRSQYAARALASSNSEIPLYVQNVIGIKINEIFTNKKPKIAIAEKGLKGGQGGIGQFADPKKAFVDYTNL